MQATWNASVTGTNRWNRSIQKCPRDTIIAASHLLFVFTCISHRNIFTSDLSLCCTFSGNCLQTAEGVLLSGSVRSFTHCIRTLISSYRCRTRVGGVEFGPIMAESNLDWLSGDFLHWYFRLWSTAGRQSVNLAEERERYQKENRSTVGLICVGHNASRINWREGGCVTQSHWAPFLLEKSIWRTFLVLSSSTVIPG